MSKASYQSHTAPPRISVIVPAYNVEKYVTRALDSIVANTFSDFELLVIDDGSSDATASLVADFAAHNSCVRLIQQQHAGVSAARNLGLAQAQGEYVCFVDADDEVPADYFERLYTEIDARQLDWVACSYCYTEYDEAGNLYQQPVPPIFLEPSPVLHGELARDTTKRAVFLGPSEKLPLTSLWGIYRLSTIREHKLSFSEDLRVGEDMVFNYALAHVIDGFAYLSDLHYIYYLRSDQSSAINDAVAAFSQLEAVLTACEAVRLRAGEALSDEMRMYTYLGAMRLIHRDELLKNNVKEKELLKPIKEILGRNPCKLYLAEMPQSWASENAQVRADWFLLKHNKLELLLHHSDKFYHLYSFVWKRARKLLRNVK